jgi:hypothetical protein
MEVVFNLGLIVYSFSDLRAFSNTIATFCILSQHFAYFIILFNTFSGGYRSCITYLDNLILAVGGQSCDYADESGIFKEMSGNFFTVKVNKYGKSGAVAFASGPTGKIAKLNFVPTK